MAPVDARALWPPALLLLTGVSYWLAPRLPPALGGGPGERRLAAAGAAAGSWCDARAGGGAKLLLTSDLFDIGDGGALPEVLKEMVSETGWAGSGATAVWLRDGRAGWPDHYQRFMAYDLPGMQRLTSLGISRHVGLWINREDAPDGRMVLEYDIVGNLSEVADLIKVKAAIDEAVVFYVPGGEPYKLLKFLRTFPGREVWSHTLMRIRRGELVYLARSAGTIIAGSNVDVTGFRSGSALEEVKVQLGDPINWAGLSLLPGNFAIRPHYTAGNMLGAGVRNGHNRGNWSDDDFIEHLQESHPGVHPLAIVDGDWVACHRGKIKFGHTFPQGWRAWST